MSSEEQKIKRTIYVLSSYFQSSPDQEYRQENLEIANSLKKILIKLNKRRLFESFKINSKDVSKKDSSNEKYGGSFSLAAAVRGPYNTSNTDNGMDKERGSGFLCGRRNDKCALQGIC